MRSQLFAGAGAGASKGSTRVEEPPPTRGRSMSTSRGQRLQQTQKSPLRPGAVRGACVTLSACGMTDLMSQLCVRVSFELQFWCVLAHMIGVNE